MYRQNIEEVNETSNKSFTYDFTEDYDSSDFNTNKCPNCKMTLSFHRTFYCHSENRAKFKSGHFCRHETTHRHFTCSICNFSWIQEVDIKFPIAWKF